MGFQSLKYFMAGYVTVQIEGLFPERFFTVLSRRNLEIRNVRKLGDRRMVGEMPIDVFRQIRGICRRTRSRVRVVKRHGLPFLLARYQKRRALVPSVLVVLLLLWYTSCHIMGITVVGNQRIDTQTILHHLSLQNVALGKSTDGIHAASIRNRMMLEIPELAWIGINVNGSRVYVEVVERLEKENGIDNETPCHLVATKDARVLQVKARNGQTQVTPNSGVIQGEVLVSGIMESENVPPRFVHAYGEVLGEVAYTLEKEYPLTYEETYLTGEEKSRYTLSVLEKSLPLFFSQKAPYARFEKEEEQKEYRSFTDSLPSLFIRRETYKEQGAVTKTRTEKEVLDLAKEELLALANEQMAEGGEILSVELSHTLTERGTVKVYGTAFVKENIAAEEIIEMGYTT